MNKLHNIQSIKTDANALYLTVDVKTYLPPWSDCSSRLARATAAQRKRFEISPAGYMEFTGQK